MKKTIALLLAAISIFSVTACGKTADPPMPSVTVTQQAAATPIAQEIEREEPVVEEEAAEEIVVVDNDQVIFKFTGFDPDGSFGYEIKCYLENKTDREVHFAFDDFSVNGYLINPFWGSSVPAGKKSNSSFYLLQEDLDLNGIDEVEEIEFRLLVMPQIDGEIDTYDRQNAYLDEVYTVSFD